MKTPSHGLPNEIVRAVFQYLPPTDIAKAAAVSKVFDRMAKDDTTWKLIANNLKVPIDPKKTFKANVMDYYEIVNKASEGFLRDEPEFNNIQKFLSKDPVTRHAQIRLFLNSQPKYLSLFIATINERIKEKPNNPDILFSKAFLDVLLDDWINNPLNKSPIADAFTSELGKDENLIKSLIQKGAIIDKFTIEKVVEKGYMSALQLILDKGIVPEYGALFKALGEKHLEMLKILLTMNIKITRDEYQTLIDVAEIRRDGEEDPAAKEEFRQIVELLESYKK